MIEPNLPGLSVGKQCALLSISRSSFYYEPKGETQMNLDLMCLIDKQFLETPFYGVRQMTWHLRNETHPPPHAVDGPDADLPKAQHEQGSQRAQDLPLPVARSSRGSAQSGLVR